MMTSCLCRLTILVGLAKKDHNPKQIKHHTNKMDMDHIEVPLEEINLHNLFTIGYVWILTAAKSGKMNKEKKINM